MRSPLAPRLAVATLALAAAACGGGGRPDAPDARTATPTPTVAPPRTATPTATPAATSPAWTRARVLRRLAGRGIRVAGRRIRLDPSTLTCVGLPSALAGRGGTPAWTRFRCVQPTFPPGQVVGPDLVFVVRPTGRRTFEVLERRLTSY